MAADIAAALVPALPSSDTAVSPVMVWEQGALRTVETWQYIEGIGDLTAVELYDYFQATPHLELFQQFEDAGIRVTLPAQAPAGSPFAGKSFLFTGGLDHWTRPEAEELVRNLGGSVSSSVPKKLDVLVAGHDAGSKLDKAQAAGVIVISEEEFGTFVRSAQNLVKQP